MKSQTIETLHLELSVNEGFCLKTILNEIDGDKLEGNKARVFLELTETLKEFDR